MPGVSQNMKDTIGKTLTDVIKNVVPKLLLTADKIKKLSGSDSADAKNLEKLQTDLKALSERQKNLDVGGLDDKRYQLLKTEIAKIQETAKKMLNRMLAEAVKAAKDGWKLNVTDKSGKVLDLSGYDSTLQGVFEKIVLAGGGGHHGNTQLGGTHGQALHWVSGSIRIFGKFEGGKLKLIGIGKHAGSDSTYKVDLVGGGSTTAKTA